MTQADGIQPLHYIPFDGPRGAGDVFFLDDSGRAIVHSRVEAIDLWDVGVFVWPEAFGTLAALWLLVALWIVWRRAHRPRRRGVLFCRRCNYELGANHERDGLLASGGRCPECGSDITPRLLIRGCAQRWRIARPLALGLLPAAAVGALLATVGVDRTGAATRWCSLPSVRLSVWTADRGWTWFDRFRHPQDVIEEWDLASGRSTRLIRLGGSRTYTRGCLTADGGGLVMVGDRYRSLVCIDVRSGKIRSRLPLPDRGRLAHGQHAIVAHPTEPDVVFALVLDFNAEEHVLYEWDTTSGASKELRRMPAWSYKQGFPAERRLARTTVDGEPMLVTLPTFMENYNRNVFEVAVLSLQGEVVSTFEFEPLPDAHGSVVAPEEPRVFAASGVLRIAGVELPSGARLGRLAAPDGLSVVHELATDASGRFLFAASIDDAIAVRDTRAAEWRPLLIESTPTIGPQLSISPGGRWVAAVSQRDTGGTGSRRFAHDFLVWKLPEEWFEEP